MNSMQPRYDVVIAGGGPAGLAAGLFTARYGLSTLILDRGKSSLRYCAYLENYLGFPGGVKIPAFLELARAHAAGAGCAIFKERVIAVERTRATGGRFLVRTDKPATVLASRFVAATTYDVAYLRALDAPALFDENGEFHRATTDAYGRTTVEGLYLAGPLAGVESQALISAGQGAQAALGLIADIRRADGLWDAIAQYLDWVAWHGCYEGERCAAQVHQYFKDSVPEHAEVDPARVREIVDDWLRTKRTQQLTKTQVKQRGERGQRILAEHLTRLASAEPPSAHRDEPYTTRPIP